MTLILRESYKDCFLYFTDYNFNLYDILIRVFKFQPLNIRWWLVSDFLFIFENTSVKSFLSIWTKMGV